MELHRRLARRALARIVFFNMLTAGLAGGACFFALAFLGEQTAGLSAYHDTFAEVKAIKESVAMMQGQFWRLVVPVIVASFLLLGLIQWAFARGGFKKLATSAKPSTKKSGKPKATPKPQPAENRAERKNIERRTFLHLLAVLQREGRMIDFFTEDLDAYEDAQIGAAVRSIQQSCRKTLKKYINPVAVVAEQEGETISIPKGFDPNAVRLTGKVTGEPPFEGIVRHCGWKARKFELPRLTATDDPSIIAPAEIEVK